MLLFSGLICRRDSLQIEGDCSSTQNLKRLVQEYSLYGITASTTKEVTVEGLDLPSTGSSLLDII